MTSPRVLFVSKPVVPPWHDGSKNLVRDVARNLRRAKPTVMVTPDAEPLGANVTSEPVYRAAGKFAPALGANARVLARLLRGDPLDLWHFVFAPNVASSSAAQIAIRTRRALGWRGKVVQTIASAPLRFEGISRLLFGDAIVVLSEWTRGMLLANGARAVRMHVIPPCAEAPAKPSEERMRKVRERLDLRGPLVLYPGDYEVSRGASTVAAAASRILEEAPDARVVFACRAKTPRAAEARAEIEKATAELGASVAHLGEVDDMPALLACARVVVFPVDDLYGKVDVPLVLLEAMALGVPLVLASGGPLEGVASARFVEPGDADALASEALGLVEDGPARRAHVDEGKRLYSTRFSPAAVAPQYDALYEELRQT